VIVSDARRPAQAPRRNPFPGTTGAFSHVRRAAAAAQRPGRACGAEAGAAAAAAEGGASRHYAKNVSAWLPEDADTRLTRRHVRYAQRGILWRESALERVRKCGRVPTGDVQVKVAGDVAHYAGLVTCGSVWSCPVCQPKILNRRAEEISRAAGRWHKRGNSVWLTTLTMPHDAGMPLASLMQVIAGGFRAVISGRPWLRLKKALGIVGTIRSLEVTHGVNGWHPHLHTLTFLTGDPGAEGLVAFDGHMRAKWRRYVTGAGYRPPDDYHGVKVDVCTSAEEAGAYIAKTDSGRAVGNELARGDLKQGSTGHRTPLEILDDFRWTGDRADLALWREYERATYRHQRITWSKGLRALLLPGEDEQTDEQIAAEDVGGEVVAVIEAKAWRTVVSVPGLPAALLDAVERGGLPELKAVLARYGVDVIEGGPSP